MSFTDLRNLTQSLPPQYQDSVTADFDTLKATVQGFTVAVRVAERTPYSRIRIEDEQAPFHFSVTAHFDPAEGGTDFSLEVDADINLMMKALLGGKIQEALNKAVDTLVDVSHGKRPEFPSDLG
ncbi:MAG: hypothetical protein IKZ91_03515 [Bacteroidales bacterium]|nr:hypothetical protein [Bacteroidales bacterium]